MTRAPRASSGSTKSRTLPPARFSSLWVTPCSLRAANISNLNPNERCDFQAGGRRASLGRSRLAGASALAPLDASRPPDRDVAALLALRLRARPGRHGGGPALRGSARPLASHPLRRGRYRDARRRLHL